MKGRLLAFMVIAWMVLLAVPMAPTMGEKTGGTREGKEFMAR